MWSQDQVLVDSHKACVRQFEARRGRGGQHQTTDREVQQA